MRTFMRAHSLLTIPTMAYLRGSTVALRSRSTSKFNTKRDSTNYRLAKLESVQRQRRPELKRLVIPFDGSISINSMLVKSCTAINEGTGENERIGNSITLKSIRWTGHSSQPTDFHIVMSKANDVPAYIDFTLSGAIGKQFNRDEFVTLRHVSNFHTHAASTCSINKVFPKGMRVSYTGAAASSIINNAIYCTAANGNTAATTLQGTIVVYYTDN